MRRLVIFAALAIALVVPSLVWAQNAGDLNVKGNLTVGGGISAGGGVASSYLSTGHVLIDNNGSLIPELQFGDHGQAALAGSTSPLGTLTANPGTLYLRGDGTHGEMWFATGATNADWTCVAGCAP